MDPISDMKLAYDIAKELDEATGGPIDMEKMQQEARDILDPGAPAFDISSTEDVSMDVQSTSHEEMP